MTSEPRLAQNVARGRQVVAVATDPHRAPTGASEAPIAPAVNPVARWGVGPLLARLSVEGRFGPMLRLGWRSRASAGR